MLQTIFCRCLPVLPGLPVLAARCPTLQEGRNNWPRVIDIHFERNSTVATTATAVDDLRAVTVESTGMYYLWFVTCEDALSAATVHGQTVWKNPTGYLPGEAPAVDFELVGPRTPHRALCGCDETLEAAPAVPVSQGLGLLRSWAFSQWQCVAVPSGLPCSSCGVARGEVGDVRRGGGEGN